MLENQKIQWSYVGYVGEIVINSLVNICHNKTMQLNKNKLPSRSEQCHDEQKMNVVFILVTIDQPHESMPNCKVHFVALVLHKHLFEKKPNVLQLRVLKKHSDKCIRYRKHKHKVGMSRGQWLVLGLNMIVVRQMT